MPATVIGRVTSGKTRKSYEVKWDAAGKEVYVSYGGWANVGKAFSASEAMNKAEAYVYDK